jgi:O-antigen/teichoic acid export membrane protein
MCFLRWGEFTPTWLFLSGISLAALRYGVWSLVAASVVHPLCLATLTIRSTKQPVMPYFGFRKYRDLLHVASAEVLSNLTNYISDNLSFVVAGGYLGIAALGLYRRSSDLIRLPLTYSSAVLLNVMFPLYSTIQQDISRLRRAHLHTVSLTAVVTRPLFFAVAIVPEIVISSPIGKRGMGLLAFFSCCASAHHSWLSFKFSRL